MPVFPTRFELNELKKWHITALRRASFLVRLRGYPYVAEVETGATPPDHLSIGLISGGSHFVMYQIEKAIREYLWMQRQKKHQVRDEKRKHGLSKLQDELIGCKVSSAAFRQQGHVGLLGDDALRRSVFFWEKIVSHKVD